MNTRRHLNAWRHAPARRPTGQILPAVLFGMVLLLGLGGVAGAALKATLALDIPHVGDLAAFQASPGQEAGMVPVVSASHTGQNGSSCVLDAAAMGAAHGSLLVTGQLAPPDGRFLVHWAGQADSAAKRGCGTSADLLLNSADLLALLDAGWSGPGYHDMSVAEALAAYPPG